MTKFEVRNGELKYVTRKITSDDSNPIAKEEDKTFYNLDKKSLVIKLESNAQGAISSYINSSSPVAEYDVNSLIPADLTLEIDGTGGIIPGDIIQTDYIQNKYNASISFTDSTGKRTDAGPLTYFQLFGVTQKIDPSGWKTELISKMRINYIEDGIDLEYKVPVDNPVSAKTSTIQNLDEPERPFISIPMEEEDIVGDQALDDLDFEDIPEFQEIPATVNRPNIPIPMEEEDIAGDVELEDLDFDEIPPWIPPPYPSTLSLRRAKIEIENQPERVPEKFPPDVPLIPVGGILSSDDINALIAQGLESSNISGNSTDLVEYPPEPEPTVPPSQPSAPVVGNPPVAEAPSKKEQIQTQKIISVQPSPELTNETGEVQKPQKFEEPVIELTWDNPTAVTIEVNKNITVQARRKASLPPSLIESREEIVILKSTYDPSIGSPKHPDEALRDYRLNPTFQLIYKIVPNWYTKAGHTKANSIYGERKQDVVLLRYRQKFWDEVIEAPNETGKTAIRSKADINAKLAEIGEKYKNLSPYDTWAITTGIDYASYNPATGKADYTEKGVKIVLPKGPGAN